jgi:plastocyanin
MTEQVKSLRLRPEEPEFLNSQAFEQGQLFLRKDTNELVIMGDQRGGVALLKADLSNATTGLGVSVSATAPADPRPGSLWFDTDTGELFIYFNDGDSQQWIQPAFPLITAGSGGGAASLTVFVAAASGNGNLSYNSATGQLTFTPPDLSWTNITGKPTLAAVATSGSYNDLLNRPATVANIQDLDNVTIGSVTDGQVLKYNASTSQWINASDLTGAGGSGIGLGDLSVTVATASGSGSLAYNSSTGIFTFTPPSLASLITRSGISATGDISYNNSTGVISFNNITGYITRSGISVTTASASGSGSLAYNNGTGVLTFTPPDLTSGGSASNSFATIAVAGQTNVAADSSTDTLTLVAGSNITITTDATTDTVTIAAAGGTASNSFATIAVAGQTSVAADSATDTLTLVAGTGITITTNDSTDTVTITNTVTAGATEFTGLSDRSDLTVDQFYLPAITRLNTTNNGASAYRYDQYGTADNPTVYALNGATIAFNLNVTGHPFLIQTSGGSNYNEGLTHVTTAGVVTTGASAQGKTSGTLYWKIPSSISGNYRYQCSIHGGMVGIITIKDFSAI